MKEIKNFLVYKILREFKNLFTGLGRSVKCCASNIIVVIKDHLWDKRLGIKTSVPYRFNDELSLHKDMYIYTPTPYGLLEKVIDYLKLGYKDIFIDFGCGQGRVIFFVAAQKLKKVIGVELNQELVDIARENQKNLKLNNTPVEIINADAATFQLRDETVFFIYNSFGVKTTKAILDNIKRSLISNPRKIRMVYYNAQHRFLFDGQDWLRQEVDWEKDLITVFCNK